MVHSLAEIEQFIVDAGSDSLEVFGGTYEGGIHIQQVPDELAPCVKVLLDSGEKVQNLLEIGAAAGGTTYLLNHFFGFDNIVLIDDNQHWKYELRPDILKGINRKEIVGNSRDQTVIDQVEGQFDILVIDGDHSYQGVNADIENYLPFLREGGFLMLHDTATNIWGCDVPAVVEELKQLPGLNVVGEFISQKHPAPCGLALFQKVTA